jgi:hypothetical protein
MSIVIKGNAFSPPICLVALLGAKKTIAPSRVHELTNVCFAVQFTESTSLLLVKGLYRKW